VIRLYLPLDLWRFSLEFLRETDDLLRKLKTYIPLLKIGWWSDKWPSVSTIELHVASRTIPVFLAILFWISSKMT
jgi:hypothetical protein